MKKFFRNLPQCDIKKKSLRGYRHFEEFLKGQRMAVYKSWQPAKFAGYLYCFTSPNMPRRSTHNHLLFTKLQLLKNLKKKTLQRQRQKSMIWLVERQNIIVLHVLHAFKHISMTQSAKDVKFFKVEVLPPTRPCYKNFLYHLSPSSERTPNHFVQHDQYGKNRKMLNLAQSLKFCCNSHRSLLNSLFSFSVAGFLSILANVVTSFYVRYFVCTFFFLFLLRFCTSEYK
mgnify:FL=1